jgi:hypothetical protein
MMTRCSTSARPNDEAIGKLTALLSEQPDHFEAQLALGMALLSEGRLPDRHCRRPQGRTTSPQRATRAHEPLLFYMKAGDKQKAEHHGLQARIAGWRENMAPPEAARRGPGPAPGPAQTAATESPAPRDMPWKKKPPAAQPGPPAVEKARPSEPTTNIDSPPPSNS